MATQKETTAPHETDIQRCESSENASEKGLDFGHGPLAHVRTNLSANLPAFGGEMQPCLYRSVSQRKFANPDPLGLSAFALTTFVLSLINLEVRNLGVPRIIISLAFSYGGLVQLLAGMWEMAIGNTFGATALSSYGSFWIAFAIILTPGGFQIEATIEEAAGPDAWLNSIGFFLMGWFIFTTILLICTLKSTVAFCANGAPHKGLMHAGGGFGIITAFLAWYNAFAGIADTSNSFFIVPVGHFPWSEKGRSTRLGDGNNDAV
ncbi:uncharacterized protein Z520_08577 [Fonsecaea multimorphosa CBS 102226]|uniref:Acetate permease A n=1 Tax=Fonsecaea multimorphosa CBS 102226 TaxID=1442371 RepID=A0A0D2JZ88_9EURO|nr:uncharacterized protein Z520_08577 [Fonsecaea multimorphosa CBS 102226]KIX95869.1 hypothetical protein Z520_08577 [Fonsecaea multimorphosa CBS 102226]OAL21604.1 hypothetical protein AYO22_08000 [Fonsecaea multimorphosa]